MIYATDGMGNDKPYSLYKIKEVLNINVSNTKKEEIC